MKTSHKARPIHPFPARMAHEIALLELASLTADSLVLDPMVGSGTVVRMASEHGHRALGFDIDPLAVLMARVWTTPVDVCELRGVAARIANEAFSRTRQHVTLPWIDDDPNTSAFVHFWFGHSQREELRKVSSAILEVEDALGDALRVALSSIIVTKNGGASLARDVSHSRPHRVRIKSDYSVTQGFLAAAMRLAHHLENQPPPGGVAVIQGDARSLDTVSTNAVDAVVTSPPYLNAIDYLRGHRLALVWLGHRVGDLRTLRRTSIGAERYPESDANLRLAEELALPLGPLTSLPRRQRHMLYRYLLDLHAMMGEVQRVLRPDGKALFVVGNSSLRGVFINNAEGLTSMAVQAGLQLEGKYERTLPPSRRYLPPPDRVDQSTLGNRMRTETVLTFTRS